MWKWMMLDVHNTTENEIENEKKKKNQKNKKSSALTTPLNMTKQRS